MNIISLIRLLGISALFSCLPAFAQLVPITGLFNTGVDSSGVALAAGAADSHYVVTATTAPSGVVLGDSYIHPNNYGGASASAKWIVANTGSGSGSGDGKLPGNSSYSYTLTFDLPTGTIVSTAAFTGKLRADDSVTVFLNGNQIFTGGTYNADSNFNASTGFLATGNVLTFTVTNNSGVANFSGLLVSNLSGNVQLTPVPEMGAFAPFGLVLLAGGAFWLHSRRQQKAQPQAAV